MNAILDNLSEFLDPQISPLSNIFPKKVIKINYIINFQKAGTLFAMFFLMWYFNNYSLGAWVYLALHGSYGIKLLNKE